MTVSDIIQRYRINFTFIIVSAVCAVCVLMQTAATADYHGQIILTIKYDDEVREFSTESLQNFETQVIKADTNWTDGVNEFEGPLVRDVLATFGIDSTFNDLAVKALALDDYTVNLPVTEFFDYDIILAMKMNGEILTRRDKGPLWIVYPSIEYPEFNAEGNHFKWVWQLFELEITSS